jgi:N-acetylglutamate synthase-like GNAT family acetyltransferase
MAKLEAVARPTLRSATPDDVPAIIALLEANHLPAWELEQHLENFVVAEDGGRVTGCGGFEAYPAAPAALVRSMAVDEPLRGSGLGSEILHWVMERAQSLGLTQLYLFTMLASDFYARFGFETVTLNDFPKAVRKSGQYQWLSEHGKDWPQIVAMAKR